MLKDAPYKEKFGLLQQWIPTIIESIKKDLKNEHLKKDLGFLKNYFAGKNPNKLTSEELAQAYTHALQHSENAEELGEFLSNRWLLRHSDLYHYFEIELTKITSDFNEIEELDQEKSIELMEGAILLYGALNTYLFSVLNSVVFPREAYETLKQRALEETERSQKENAALIELKSLDDMKRSYELQIARLTDKYEKKLLGLQKKYTIDVENLKKQVSNLQRKLVGKDQ